MSIVEGLRFAWEIRFRSWWGEALRVSSEMEGM